MLLQENSVFTKVKVMPDAMVVPKEFLTPEQAMDKYLDLVKKADDYYVEQREAFKKEHGQYPSANMTKLDAVVAEFATLHGIEC